MNGVLMPLLLTLDKYLFWKKLSLEIIKLAVYNIIHAMTKYYRLIASWTKFIIMNLHINRNFPKKQLNVYPKKVKNVLVYMTALAGAQQEQSTLQNIETWNATNSKNFLVLKNVRGIWWFQLYSDYRRFISTDSFEVDQALFTNISSES